MRPTAQLSLMMSARFMKPEVSSGTTTNAGAGVFWNTVIRSVKLHGAERAQGEMRQLDSVGKPLWSHVTHRNQTAGLAQTDIEQVGAWVR